MKFERIVNIIPAHDCIRVQPCKFGSDSCTPGKGGSHGIHNAELSMYVRTSVAEVGLNVNTGWYLPVTVRHKEDSLSGEGIYVGYHSSVPWYEGQEPSDSECQLWPVCYQDASYLHADVPAKLLVEKGSDALWEYLEARYKETWGE